MLPLFVGAANVNIASSRMSKSGAEEETHVGMQKGPASKSKVWGPICTPSSPKPYTARTLNPKPDEGARTAFRS